MTITTLQPPEIRTTYNGVSKGGKKMATKAKPGVPPPARGDQKTNVKTGQITTKKGSK